MAGVNAEAPTASDAAASAIAVLLNITGPPSLMPSDGGLRRGVTPTAFRQANACLLPVSLGLLVAVLVCRKPFCRSAKCHKGIEPFWLGREPYAARPLLALADMLFTLASVCFWVESGHDAGWPLCQLLTQSGHSKPRVAVPSLAASSDARLVFQRARMVSYFGESGFLHEKGSNRLML